MAYNVFSQVKNMLETFKLKTFNFVRNFNPQAIANHVIILGIHVNFPFYCSRLTVNF